MKKNYVLDTNILIQYPSALFDFDDNNVIITTTTLQELDSKKTADAEVGYGARETLRNINKLKGDYTEEMPISNSGEFRIVKDSDYVKIIPPEYSLDKPDNRIINTVLGIGASCDIETILVTNDISMKINATTCGCRVQEYHNELTKMSCNSLYNKIQSGKLNFYVISLFFDCFNTLQQALKELSNDKTVVIHTFYGGSDIDLTDIYVASSKNAIIIGLDVCPNEQVKAEAEQNGVELRLYHSGREAIRDIKTAINLYTFTMTGKKIIGRAKVRRIIKASGDERIAVSYVTDGYFQRNCLVRVMRKGEQIFEGKLSSLKRNKNDVDEVPSLFECSLVIANFSDIKESDIVEAYILIS